MSKGEARSGAGQKVPNKARRIDLERFLEEAVDAAGLCDPYFEKAQDEVLALPEAARSKLRRLLARRFAPLCKVVDACSAPLYYGDTLALEEIVAVATLKMLL
jgi:hypothetical protein